MPGYLKYVLALVCCFILGNLYYSQPIIADIARDVGISMSSSGVIVTITQIGYCLGVLFLVPLGDALESRRLIRCLVAVSCVALVSASLASSQIVFLVSMFCVGLFSCSVQIIIPMSVGMADEKDRGQVVGLIISGALLGIVLSRPASSFITGMFGWRATYIFAAVLMVIVLLCLHYVPRKIPQAQGIRYPQMLLSMARLLTSVRGVKRRLGTMSLVFTTFTLFWATVPIALQDLLGFSHSQVALYSLLGLAAPPCAIMAGKMIDRGKGFALTVFSIAMVVCAFVVTPVFGMFVASFIVAGLLLDPGVQMTNVVIQQSVIGLAPQARSRINALCIAATFIGGAFGSWLGPWIYSHYGWPVTVMVAALIVLVAFALNLSLKSTSTEAGALGQQN